jgi:F-type H+-transporting ATPase subunit epsilon
MAEDTNQLRVRLVTPERTLFEAAAAAVELPAKTGYMEVLYGHAPLMAELGAGDVTIHGSPAEAGAGEGAGTSTRYNVSWGFVEVLPSRVTILANDALKPEEIDLGRARQQLDRGQKMWNEAGESEEAYDEALRVISEAEAKIASAGEVAKAH